MCMLLLFWIVQQDFTLRYTFVDAASLVPVSIQRERLHRIPERNEKEEGSEHLKRKRREAVKIHCEVNEQISDIRHLFHLIDANEEHYVLL